MDYGMVGFLGKGQERFWGVLRACRGMLNVRTAEERREEERVARQKNQAEAVQYETGAPGFASARFTALHAEREVLLHLCRYGKHVKHKHVVYLTTVDGTARAGTDYLPLKRHEVVFKPGQSWATVKVSPSQKSLIFESTFSVAKYVYTLRYEKFHLAET